MNSKVAAGLALVVAVAAAIAFATLRDSGPPGPASVTPAADTGTTTNPAAPPVSAEDAELLAEINQVITEVTKEALERPEDQKMTAEEIQQRITSRIEELKAQR